MYASYHFLVELPDALPYQDIERVRQHVEAAYEARFSRYLDDNNWGNLTEIVLDDDTIIDLQNDEVSAHERLEQMTPKPGLFQSRIVFATRCVAYDLSVHARTATPGVFHYDSLGRQDRDTLLTRIRTELAPAYATPVPRPAYNDDFEYPAYARWRVSDMLRALDRSAVAPFTRLKRTPYHYRAFDLRLSRRKSQRLAILHASLHT